MATYNVVIYDDDEYYDEKMHSELECIIKKALETIKPEFDLTVNISIVSKEEIKELNRDNRNVDKVTDVLSFPMLEWESPEVLRDEISDFDYDPETNTVFLGDIILCKEKIEEQAEEFGHSLLRESVYLTLHGILHLLGYDHIEDSDKVVMRAKEKEILNEHL